ncbi:MAG: dihydroorotate dehydrogenase [Oscillospiraceae bacterium]|nr:dihydroorotate dehydrogenase [Oscillospiraceae bacterium]
MADLSVKIAGVEFSNPVIAASGTFGNGECYTDLYPISKLGGISCKGMTIEPKQGNPPPRIAETYSGILNSVGLQNIGVRGFIDYYLPTLKQDGNVIIANVSGATIEDYVRAAELLDQSDVDMIELNISCPNVKAGGATWGISCDGAASVTREVRKATKKPLIVKLTPNVTDITEIAKAVESEGADAISMINTLLGMRIDIRTRRPILRNNMGGLSGPAVFPVAVRMVRQCYKAVSLPIIGMGGISTWEDAVEIMLAGASAVQMGTAIFTDPYSPLKVIDGLAGYMDKNGIKSLSEIVGQCQEW